MILFDGKSSIAKYIIANVIGDKKLKVLMYCYRMWYIWYIFGLMQILLIMSCRIIYKRRISIWCIITFAYNQKAILIKVIWYWGNLYNLWLSLSYFIFYYCHPSIYIMLYIIYYYCIDLLVSVYFHLLKTCF